MNIETKKRVLEAHGVPFCTKDGRLYADSMISGTAIFEMTEDVTDWTRSQLYSWLGY